MRKNFAAFCRFFPCFFVSLHLFRASHVIQRWNWRICLFIAQSALEIIFRSKNTKTFKNEFKRFLVKNSRRWRWFIRSSWSTSIVTKHSRDEKWLFCSERAERWWRWEMIDYILCWWRFSMITIVHIWPWSWHNNYFHSSRQSTMEKSFQFLLKSRILKMNFNRRDSMTLHEVMSDSRLLSFLKKWENHRRPSAVRNLFASINNFFY